MKRIFACIACTLTVGCLIAAVGCAETEPVPAVFREIQIPYTGSTAQHEEWTLEETVENATDIFTATFVRYVGNPEDGGFEMEFTVGDVIRGGCAEDTIYVYKRLENWTGELYEEYNYVEGHEYLLVLNRRESVYYDHDIYLSTGNIFMPLSDSVCAHMEYEPLSEKLEQDTEQTLSESASAADNRYLASYIEDISDSTTAPSYAPTTRFTRETELAAILPESEFVLLVEPSERMSTGAWNTETFICEVVETLVGEGVPGEIYFTFFSGQAEIGGRYYIAANRSGGVDSDSVVFAQSSKNRVIAADDEPRVSELLAELGIER